MSLVKQFIRSEAGLAATEYAVMLSLIVLAAVAAIVTLGQRVNSTFVTAAREAPVG